MHASHEWLIITCCSHFTSGEQLKVNLAFLAACFYLTVSISGVICQPRELGSSMMFLVGESNVCEIGYEWYCTAFLGAMYAGIFMILNVGQIFYCEESPSTTSLPFCFGFVF